MRRGPRDERRRSSGRTRRPPAPLPVASPRSPRRHSPRSEPRAAGRAALGLRQARSGPGSGGGRAIVRCIVGAARAGDRAVKGAVPRLSMVPPARRLERLGRCAGGARGPPGAGRAFARVPPSLSASKQRRAERPTLTWLLLRGHGVPRPCACLSCCCFCGSRGCWRAPGTRLVTCSTAHAWVRPREPAAQMGKLRPKEANSLLRETP